MIGMRGDRNQEFELIGFTEITPQKRDLPQKHCPRGCFCLIKKSVDFVVFSCKIGILVRD